MRIDQPKGLKDLFRIANRLILSAIIWTKIFEADSVSVITSGYEEMRLLSGQKEMQAHSSAKADIPFLIRDKKDMVSDVDLFNYICRLWRE